MKIAVLAHSFPRFRGDTHGTFVKSLCEALARLGHQVFVVIPFDPEIRDDPDSPLEIRPFRYGWPDRLHAFGYSRTFHRDISMRFLPVAQAPFYLFFGERALKKLVREEGIEMIHAHWHLPNGYLAWKVSRQLGIPFATTLHGSDVFVAEKNVMTRRMARQTLGGVAHVTSCSADLQERLARIGRPEDRDKVLLVPNGTEADVPTAPVPGADPAPWQADVGPGDRLLTAVGRMVDKKGFRYLIEAMPTVLQSEPRARLILGGGGDLLEPLRARTRELGIANRVTFPGMLPHPRVLELVATGEIFVMPSVRDERGNIDGLPIVVLEAMAAGRPVVATDLAGIPLAVEPGKTGLLVPEKDPEALAAAILEVLADPEAARRMGAAGREKVRNELSWDAIARRHDELFRRAVAGGDSAGGSAEP